MAAYQQRTRLVTQLLPLLRSPGGGRELQLVERKVRRDGSAVEAFLLDHDAHQCFPVMAGIPRLLPTTNRLMSAAAAELSDFEGVDGFSLPDIGAGGAELEHYELNGIHDVTMQEFDSHRVETACRLLPDDTESLIDIGAGPGPFLARLQSARPQMLAFGLERSSAALAAAPLDVAMIQGSADVLPLADGSVDCSVSMETLEHLPDPVHRAALAEMARVARRYVLVNVPYRERRLQTQCRYCDCVFNPNYHMRSYDDERLGSLVPGFTVRQRVLLPRSETILKALVAPFRSRVFGPLDYAICPQCGMSGSSAATTAPDGGQEGSGTVGNQVSARGALRAIASRMPKVQVRGEILVLYERQ